MSRRVDIRAILRNATQRRRMMVEAIIALQSREGIETTREQAEAAYDAVQAEKASDRGGMRCPACNCGSDNMFIWYGPDGSIEGVGCDLCRRSWYSEGIADKVHDVVGHALRGLVNTTPFPEDAREAGEYGSDPRYDQQEFEGGDWIWRVPGDDEADEQTRGQTENAGSRDPTTEGADDPSAA